MELVKQNATREDLERVPEHLVGELIEGRLYVMPRPRGHHAICAGWIQNDVYGPYHRGRGGPGGWWVLSEPGIELPGATEIVPDVAGWRRDRMPVMPGDKAIDVVPDWVCEVQSPTTGELDYRVKMPFYARAGVSWLWMVSPKYRGLYVHRNVEGRWELVAAHEGNVVVSPPPFEAARLDLGALWMELPVEASDSGR